MLEERLAVLMVVVVLVTAKEDGGDDDGRAKGDRQPLSQKREENVFQVDSIICFSCLIVMLDLVLERKLEHGRSCKTKCQCAIAACQAAARESKMAQQQPRASAAAAEAPSKQTSRQAHGQHSRARRRTLNSILSLFK